jgi:hypothetical protein
VSATDACVICDGAILPHQGANTRDGERVHSSCCLKPGTREVRACKVCGHPRKVWVSLYWQSGKVFVEYYPTRCNACKMMASAAVHERTAAELRRKALAILEKRAKAK